LKPIKDYDYDYDYNYDYDYVIDYHLKKSNVIADALSHINKAGVDELIKCDKREMIELKSINFQLEVGLEGSLLAHLRVLPIL
jgi:hypothetical protein